MSIWHEDFTLEHVVSLRNNNLNKQTFTKKKTCTWGGGSCTDMRRIRSEISKETFQNVRQ